MICALCGHAERVHDDDSRDVSCWGVTGETKVCDCAGFVPANPEVQ